MRNFFHPPSPVPQTLLPEGQLRRQILAQAARFAGKPSPALPPESQPDFAASLKHDIFVQPLTVMLAALAANELGLLPGLDPLARRAGLDDGQEGTRLGSTASRAIRKTRRKSAPSATSPPVPRWNAALPPQELERAMGEELTALKITWPDGSGDLAAVLRQALPGVHLPVAPVEPDRGGHQARHGEPLSHELKPGRATGQQPGDPVELGGSAGGSVGLAREACLAPPGKRPHERFAQGAVNDLERLARTWVLSVVPFSQLTNAD